MLTFHQKINTVIIMGDYYRFVITWCELLKNSVDQLQLFEKLRAKYAKKNLRRLTEKNLPNTENQKK